MIIFHDEVPYMETQMVFFFKLYLLNYDFWLFIYDRLRRMGASPHVLSFRFPFLRTNFESVFRGEAYEI